MSNATSPKSIVNRKIAFTSKLNESDTLQEQFFNARTKTRDKINVTALNSLVMIVAANSITKKEIEKNKLTMSFTRFADYIVDQLNIAKCYHKANINNKDYKRFDTMSDSAILATAKDKAIVKSAITRRIAKHCFDHFNNTKLCAFKAFLTNVNTESLTITFKKDFVLSVQSDKKIKSHMNAMHNEFKQKAIVKKSADKEAKTDK